MRSKYDKRDKRDRRSKRHKRSMRSKRDKRSMRRKQMFKKYYGNSWEYIAITRRARDDAFCEYNTTLSFAEMKNVTDISKKRREKKILRLAKVELKSLQSECMCHTEFNVRLAELSAKVTHLINSSYAYQPMPNNILNDFLPPELLG